MRLGADTVSILVDLVGTGKLPCKEEDAEDLWEFEEKCINKSIKPIKEEHTTIFVVAAYWILEFLKAAMDCIFA